MSTITIESEALTTLVTEVAAEAAAAALAKFGVVIQQPKAEAPTTRSAKPTAAAKPTTSKTRSTTASRSAKPVSEAQHKRGSVIELAFGIRADGTLTPNQQARAREFFGERSEAATKALGKTVTMRSIVRAVQIVNGNERGEGSTLRYWAVWNGPKGIGRLTDKQARELLRSSK